ncbi:MAG TPA: hypothetical protein VL120_02555 [Solirubrobacteraceae bacterium]|jgi:hypothetical protein|nr:hypothetical protein [Solirubrobacteraceae bacterium]
MKRLFVIAVSALVLAATAASPAAAAPLPSFLATPIAGLTMTLDEAGAIPCQYGPCGYNWKYFTPTTNRLGVQMGNLAQIAYRFPAAGYYTIVLTVSNHCSATARTWCPKTISQQVYVPLLVGLPLPLPL